MSWFDRKKKVLKNGLIDIPEEHREIVAIYETGEIYYVLGKKFHVFVQEAQKYVRETLQKDPHLNESSGEDVVGHYRNLSTSDESDTYTAEHERVAEHMLQDAADAKAADIKIIRTPEQTVIRFIIAGQEIDYDVHITSQEGNALISFIFDARDEGAGHSTKMQSEFQGFSVSSAQKKSGSGINLPKNVLKLRCQKGFHETSTDIMDHVAIRIFYRESDEMASLEDLGLDPVSLEALQSSRDGMKGATTIGGETGDGKSTTLISNIQRQYHENEGQVSIVTVEDPVEYKLNEPGIIQIPLKSAGDAKERSANYRAALMHFVRINPHIGMISEMRDVEAARQVLQFIETGHQVWTTIHINSVNSIPFRLIDMGIEPTELSKPDSIKLMMKQTLVPILCRCATKGDDGYMHRDKAGCKLCKSKVKGAMAEKAWSGLQRLAALAEFIEPDDKYLGFIRSNDVIGAKNYWESSKEDGGMGGINLKQKLLYLVQMGAVDPKDAIKKGANIPKIRGEVLINQVYVDWIQDLLDKRSS